MNATLIFVSFYNTKAAKPRLNSRCLIFHSRITRISNKITERLFLSKMNICRTQFLIWISYFFIQSFFIDISYFLAHFEMWESHMRPLTKKRILTIKMFILSENFSKIFEWMQHNSLNIWSLVLFIITL